jgi:hypothetical protein
MISQGKAKTAVLGAGIQQKERPSRIAAAIEDLSKLRASMGDSTNRRDRGIKNKGENISNKTIHNSLSISN